MIVGLFEELGWRGSALPRLQRRQPALVLGAVWALRRLPELISDPNGQRPPVQFLVGIVAQSVVLAWLHNSKSIAVRPRKGSNPRLLAHGAFSLNRPSGQTLAATTHRRLGHVS